MTPIIAYGLFTSFIAILGYVTYTKLINKYIDLVNARYEKSHQEPVE